MSLLSLPAPAFDVFKRRRNLTIYMSFFTVMYGGGASTLPAFGMNGYGGGAIVAGGAVVGAGGFGNGFVGAGMKGGAVAVRAAPQYVYQQPSYIQYQQPRVVYQQPRVIVAQQPNYVYQQPSFIGGAKGGMAFGAVSIYIVLS